MIIYHKEISIQTKHELDIVDISDKIYKAVEESKVENGLINVFSIGSTAAISIMEYEPGLKEDLSRILDKIVPKDIEYKHHERWGDFNGHSHIRATIIKSSLTIPLIEGKPVLGTWQQVIFIELDTRARHRKIIISVVGE